MKKLVRRTTAMLLHPVTGEEAGENEVHTGMPVTDVREFDSSVGRFSKPYRWIFVVWTPYWIPEFPEVWGEYRNYYIFISMKKPEVTE